MIKKLFTIGFILALLNVITKDSLAIEMAEAEKWIGKNVVIYQDVALTPSGTFCKVEDVLISKRDKYMVVLVYHSSFQILGMIDIETILKIKEYRKVTYQDVSYSGDGGRNSSDNYSPEYLKNVGARRASLEDRLSPEYIRKKYSW